MSSFSFHVFHLVSPLFLLIACFLPSSHSFPVLPLTISNFAIMIQGFFSLMTLVMVSLFWSPDFLITQSHFHSTQDKILVTWSMISQDFKRGQVCVGTNKLHFCVVRTSTTDIFQCGKLKMLEFQSPNYLGLF